MFGYVYNNIIKKFQNSLEEELKTDLIRDEQE